MSRLYGRSNDVYSVSKYFQDRYVTKYKKDNKKIKTEELEVVPKVISAYLPDNALDYLNNQEVDIAWNLFIRDTVYNSDGQDNPVIIYPSKTMKEEYKRELAFFFGDLLRRLSLDYLPDQFDIRCQYSDILPLLIEYLYLKETGNPQIFSDKHLKDLALNARKYIQIYDDYFFKEQLGDNSFLTKTLLYLIPLSSMDATLQIIDNMGEDKEELRRLISELVDNPEHNREIAINKRNIDTYGFKRLRKEIDLKSKRGRNE